MLAFEHVPGDGKPRRPATGRPAASARPGSSGSTRARGGAATASATFARWFGGILVDKAVRARAVGRGDRPGGRVHALMSRRDRRTTCPARSMSSGRCSGSAAATTAGRPRTRRMRSSSRAAPGIRRSSIRQCARRPRLLGSRAERSCSAVGGRVPGGHPGGTLRRLQYRLLARARLDACRSGPRRGDCGGSGGVGRCPLGRRRRGVRSRRLRRRRRSMRCDGRTHSGGLLATRGRPGRRSRSARAGARVLPLGRRTCYLRQGESLIPASA